jgi:hypothetical protein
MSGKMVNETVQEIFLSTGNSEDLRKLLDLCFKIAAKKQFDKVVACELLKGSKYPDTSIYTSEKTNADSDGNRWTHVFTDKKGSKSRDRF